MDDTDALGDAIAAAVAESITDAHAEHVVSHVHAKSYSEPVTCPDCDAIAAAHTDDDPTADTDY